MGLPHRVSFELGLNIASAADEGYPRKNPRARELPRTVTAIEHLLAQLASRQENWPALLVHSRNSIAAQEALDEPIVNPSALFEFVAQAHARMGDPATAEAVLKDADAWAGDDPSRRRSVVSARVSLAPQLQYGEQNLQFDEGESRLLAARNLEQAGRFLDAIALHLADAREARLTGDRHLLASALLEAGRITTVTPEDDPALVARGVTWLEECTRIRHALGMPNYRTYYYLACAYEAQGMWAMADNCLDVSIADAPSTALSHHADASYERAIVIARSVDHEHPDREQLRRALEFLAEAAKTYRRLGHMVFASDAHILAAQLAMASEDRPVVEAELALALSAAPGSFESGIRRQALEELRKYLDSPPEDD